MQALHDDDHSALRRFVESCHGAGLQPFEGPLANGLRGGVGRLDRIVQDEDVGAHAGEGAADRGREPATAGGELQIIDRRQGLAQLRAWEDRLILRGLQDLAALARELVGEVRAIGSGDDPKARVAAKHVGRKGDRAEVGLSMPRRRSQEEPPDLAIGHVLQRVADDRDVVGVDVGHVGHQGKDPSLKRVKALPSLFVEELLGEGRLLGVDVSRHD